MHVVFAGHPVVLNVTVSLNPPEGVTVTANVVEAPFMTRRRAGVAPIVKSPTCGPHDANLNDPMRVLQLNEPVAFKNSLVNQNVQSSAGSSVTCCNRPTATTRRSATRTDLHAGLDAQRIQWITHLAPGEPDEGWTVELLVE